MARFTIKTGVVLWYCGTVVLWYCNSTEYVSCYDMGWGERNVWMEMSKWRFHRDCNLVDYLC